MALDVLMLVSLPAFPDRPGDSWLSVLISGHHSSNLIYWGGLFTPRRPRSAWWRSGESMGRFSMAPRAQHVPILPPSAPSQADFLFRRLPGSVSLITFRQLVPFGCQKPNTPTGASPVLTPSGQLLPQTKLDNRFGFPLLCAPFFLSPLII